MGVWRCGPVGELKEAGALAMREQIVFIKLKSIKKQIKLLRVFDRLY